MRYALAAVAAAALLAGCGGHSAVTETAGQQVKHRAEVERLTGRPVADWPGYLAAASAICEQDDRTFELTVAVFQDQGGADLQRLAADVHILCPGREDQVIHAVAAQLATATPSS